MSPESQVTLATSAGPIWLALVVHVLGGSIALVSGFLAIVVAKGGKLHRRAGLVFVISMIVMGLFASVVGIYEKKVTGAGGLFTFYLVFTGLTTVRPTILTGRAPQLALMAVAIVFAIFEFTMGYIAMGQPRGMLNGVPGGMMLFLATVASLAAVGDWRAIRAGGLTGTRRIARHLWRMCFALFIASGSFFLGQMQFVPAPLRKLPLMMALGVGPLVVLLYWMWRVRLRKSVRGMIMRSAREVPGRA